MTPGSRWRPIWTAATPPSSEGGVEHEPRTNSPEGDRRHPDSADAGGGRRTDRAGADRYACETTGHAADGAAADRCARHGWLGRSRRVGANRAVGDTETVRRRQEPARLPEDMDHRGRDRRGRWQP